VLRSTPSAYFTLDGAVPLDISGNEVQAEFNGGNTYAEQIVSGSSQAVRFSGGHLDIDFPGVLQPGYESLPFVVEFWLRPETVVEHRVFGRGSNGLWILPSGLELRLGDTVEFVPVTKWRELYVALAYSDRVATLFLNGVPVTAVEVQGAFDTGQLILESDNTFSDLALYRRVVSTSNIEAHYRWGTRTSSPPPALYDWNLLPDSLSPAVTLNEQGPALLSGNTYNVSLRNSLLWHDPDAGSSDFSENDYGTEGWRYSEPVLLDMDVATSRLTWTGSAGVVMEVSFDLDQWTEVQNDSPIPGLGGEVDTFVFLRQRLAENEFLESVTLEVYDSHAVKSMQSDASVLLGQDATVSERGVSGSLVVYGIVVESLEFWVYEPDGEIFRAGDLYVSTEGSNAEHTVRQLGPWQHIVVTEHIEGVLEFTGTFKHISAYEHELTTEEANRNFLLAARGTPTLTATETTQLSVTESKWFPYMHDWQVVSA
jgi:hypothetical protein